MVGVPFVCLFRLEAHELSIRQASFSLGYAWDVTRRIVPIVKWGVRR